MFYNNIICLVKPAMPNGGPGRQKTLARGEGPPCAHNKIKDIITITAVVLIFPAKIIFVTQLFEIKNI